MQLYSSPVFVVYPAGFPAAFRHRPGGAAQAPFCRGIFNFESAIFN
jgi:hypothetical protein